MKVREGNVFSHVCVSVWGSLYRTLAPSPPHRVPALDLLTLDMFKCLQLWSRCSAPPRHMLRESNVFARVCLFVCQFMWVSVQGPISPLPDTFKLWPHCTGQVTASGQMTSYWNAFLLLTVFSGVNGIIFRLLLFFHPVFSLHMIFFTIETNPCFVCMWVAVPSFLYCSHMLVLQQVFKIQKHPANSM